MANSTVDMPVGTTTPAPARRGHPRRQSQGRKAHQRGRVTTMRTTKGTARMDALAESIRGDLFVGSSEDDALARLSETQTLNAITLSITTRGIGLGICHLTYISLAYQDNIVVPSIYVMHRVFLGLLESKLESIKKDLPVVPRFVEHTQELGVTSDLIRVARSVTIVPEPIRRIINAIGHLQHNDKVYVPAVAKLPLDRNGQTTPRPETVLLSTLRETVVYLANARTSERVRERFHENSALPGAIWGEHHILQNPNDFIAEDYNLVDDFRRDSLLIAPFMSALQKHVPKLVGGTVDFKSTGRASLLVSNEMSNLRTPDRNVGETLADYNRRCLPQGNVRNFHMLSRLTPAEKLEGQVNLLGEYPTPVNLRYPLYHNRDEASACFSSTTDYAGVCQIMYAL